MTAQLRLQVGWDDIPGNRVLHQTVIFDGTPEGFDTAIDEVRVAMHESARSPMRPCGHPGPWHELGLTRLPSSLESFAVVTTCLAYPPGSCPNERAACSDLCAEHLEVRP